jgi:hypothetical protein
MKHKVLIICVIIFSGILVYTYWPKSTPQFDIQKAGFNFPSPNNTLDDKQNGGFESQIKYGEHLVYIVGCHDCHTPKKMTEKGPVLDMSRAFSGHPANIPVPDINRADIEKKGLVLTHNLTSWVGPWGVSFSANITSDKTGIGNWQEKNFIIALREGKHKGIESARTLLPPMPWDMYSHMTDEEVKAIFAYLKTTKPIRNVVPAPIPPVSAPPGK